MSWPLWGVVFPGVAVLVSRGKVVTLVKLVTSVKLTPVEGSWVWV
jgi:hypothetical protein